MKKQLSLYIFLSLFAVVIKPAFAQHNVLSDFQKQNQHKSLLNGKLPGSISAHPVWIARLDSETAPYNGKILVLNPYEDIKWKAINQYKTNLHTHTTNSDGVFHPHQVVDLYHNAGYNILSITDHNKITYPWTAFSMINPVYENRDPLALGMLAVAGNELSAAHHTGSYLNVVPGDGANLAEAFSTMTQIDGLGAFKHPGRYWNISTNYSPDELYSIDWYEKYYEAYPALVGMEVFNMGDRYPNDRVLWDELLTRMMPARPVWGHSNDDMHGANKVFLNYNYMLMPELSLDAFRAALENGASYFAHEPNGIGQPRVPSIDSIIILQKTREIIIYAFNYSSIEWVSGVSGTGSNRESRIVAYGEIFNFEDFDAPYVRAVIINDSGRAYTQPFGFTNKPPVDIAFISGNTHFCEGKAIFSIEKDHTADAYHWSISHKAKIINGEFTNTIELDFSDIKGIVEISVHKSNSIGKSNAASLMVTVHDRKPEPEISIEGNVLQSNYPEGNQWFNETGAVEGATGQYFSANACGVYYVMVTLPGCSPGFSNTISFFTGANVPAINKPSFSTYPIPFSNILTIETEDKTGVCNYKIISLTGQILHQDSFVNKACLSTSQFQKGIYFLKIESNNSIETIKVLKQ